MNTLLDFVSHNDDVVATAATLLTGVERDFNANKLSKQEAKELVDDILDLQRVDSLMADVDRRRVIIAAFGVLSQICGTIFSFV